MPWKATTLASDSQNQATLGPDDRPDVLVTAKGRLVLVPSLDELMSRKGAAGLQICLDELSHHHFMKHGYDWIYMGATIKSSVATGRGYYFIHFGHDVHYVGSYRQAISYLLNYAATGHANHAERRAR